MTHTYAYATDWLSDGVLEGPLPGLCAVIDQWCVRLGRTWLWEIEQWMTAPNDERLKVQRPLPDGSLKIVATSAKEDAAPA
jgi:hypothetical protein